MIQASEISNTLAIYIQNNTRGVGDTIGDRIKTTIDTFINELQIQQIQPLRVQELIEAEDVVELITIEDSFEPFEVAWNQLKKIEDDKFDRYLEELMDIADRLY